MKTLLMAALAAAASTLAYQQAAAVEINALSDAPTSITIEGEIEYGDEHKLLNVLQYRRDRGLTTEFAVLHSPGGNNYSGMEMALLIRGHGVKTVVPSTGACASACMLMFAGGIERFAWYGARLGVHGASITTPDGYSQETGDGTVRLAKAMKFLGAPDAVVALLVTTSADDITWLDDRAVQGWVHLLDPREEQHQEQQQQTSESVSMTCMSHNGNSYVVNWSREGLRVRDRWYPITDAHQHPKTGAYVVTGPTKYGTYGAVFGGPNPRMEFANGKEVAKDRCW